MVPRDLFRNPPPNQQQQAMKYLFPAIYLFSILSLVGILIGMLIAVG